MYLFLKKSFSPRRVVTASRARLGSQASGLTGGVGSGLSGLTGLSLFEPVEVISLCKLQAGEFTESFSTLVNKVFRERTIQSLNSFNIISGQNERVRIGVAVRWVHQSTRYVGMLKA